MRYIIVLGLLLGGCAQWNSLTAAQQVQLVTTYVNGACVAVAAGSALALQIDTIVQPQGGSTAGTIVKVGQIGAVSCASLNGATATISKGTATATVAPAS